MAAFWATLALLGGLLYWRLMAGFSGLPPGMKARSNDIQLYQMSGERILRGEVPYRDFFIEYPPGSIPAFLPPAFFSSKIGDFAALLAAEMSLVLIATLVVVALSARKIGGALSWVVPALAFTAGTLLLYPVAVTRFDPLVSLTLALAVLCATLGGRYLLLSYASLGFGAAVKLVPILATLPLALFGRRDNGGWFWSTVGGFAIFFVTLGIFFGPAYLLGSEKFVESFTYHADRGLQLESLMAAVLMRLGWVQDTVFQYGALEVEGRGVDLLSSLSLPITGALLLITAAVMYRDHRVHGFVAGRFPRYAAALILAFMIGSKVLSPQYMLWLLPLLPLAAGGLWGIGVSGLFLIACWTTTRIFPEHYGELMDLEPAAVNILLARNLLLVLLWALMLVLPAESDLDKEKA